MVQVIDLNSDMGEGFGNWTFDNDVDVRIMPLVSSINLAAGFHAGDPSTIDRTVALAKEHGVGIGVHPGFRDLVGFGRRHIASPAAELVNDALYQLGAVREFVRRHDVELQHFKLHGALYMHAARDAEFAEAMVAGLQQVSPDLPVLVMAGTEIERAAHAAGQPVIREFYGDRQYGADGQIVFTRDAGAPTPDDIAAKVLRACQDGTVTTADGDEIAVEFESVCIHSDTRGAVDLIRRTREVLTDAGIEITSFAH